MHRKKILEDVATLVSSTRNKTHGNPQIQLSLATALKETVRGGPSYLKLSAAEREALDQILTKCSRLVCGAVILDHWSDIIGYAAIGAETCSVRDAQKPERCYDSMTNVNEDAPMARKVRR